MRGEFGGPPAVSVPGTAMMARTKMARSVIVRSLKVLRSYRSEEGTVLAPHPRSAHRAKEWVVS